MMDALEELWVADRDEAGSEERSVNGRSVLDKDVEIRIATQGRSRIVRRNLGSLHQKDSALADTADFRQDRRQNERCHGGAPLEHRKRNRDLHPAVAQGCRSDELDAMGLDVDERR